MFALKKIAGTTLSALAVAGMLMTSVAPVSAQPYRDHWRGSWSQHHHSHRHYHRHYHRDHHRHHRRDNSAAVGILGLGAGLILGGALANSANAAPPPPPPPPANYYGSPRAWTPEWRAYCTSRYRSFNPRTGYFLGYDGDYHFCR